jgi:oligopeptidase B
MIASVPFVDVLSSMLDPSLPLTKHEYDEWGEPNSEVDQKYSTMNHGV